MERTRIDPYLDPLSQRETEILGLINNGLTNEAIAHELYLSLDTIKWYNRQIFDKLAVSSRTQALVKAREYGLLDYRTSTARHNLPRQITRFIGREAEVSQVNALLERAALVTLTGPGGVGKSRLSIEAARQAAVHFADGVWFVELAPLTNPDQVSHAILRSLGLVEDPRRSVEDQIIAYLRPKQALLVLDNCEHLIEACARLAARILRECPSLSLLVSSREALGMAGEVVYATPSMQVPDPQNLPSLEEFRLIEASQLFEERARDVLPSFMVDESNMLAIAEICQRLDGIPLALELAAARMNAFTTSQLAARLDHAFEALDSLRPAALPRHQTLRATIEWSYNLLSEEEQRLLRGFSVFKGGWSLEAAEAICQADGVAVASLVNKSVVVTVRTKGEEIRYRLLETIRQFAWEKLEEAGEVEHLRDRHLEYFASWAEENGSLLQTFEQQVALNRLKEEHENMHEALNWALVTAHPIRAEHGLHIVHGLRRYWKAISAFHEGFFWMQRALSLPLTDSRPLALFRAQMLYNTAVMIGYMRGMDIPGRQETLSLFEESSSLFHTLGDPIGESKALVAIGWMIWREDLPKAYHVMDEGIRLARQAGDRFIMAIDIQTKGGVALGAKNLAEARACFAESVALFEQEGDQWLAWEISVSLCRAMILQGDLLKARAYFKEATRKYLDFQVEDINLINSSLHVSNAYDLGEYADMATLVEVTLEKARAKGDEMRLLIFLRLSGIVARVNGAPNRALNFYREGLLMAQRYGDKYETAAALAGLAGVALASEQPELAARLIGAVEALFETLGWKLGGIEKILFEQDSQAAREQLGDAAFERAWASGRLLTLEQAIHEAGSIIPVDKGEQ